MVSRSWRTCCPEPCDPPTLTHYHRMVQNTRCWSRGKSRSVSADPLGPLGFLIPAAGGHWNLFCRKARGFLQNKFGCPPLCFLSDHMIAPSTEDRSRKWLKGSPQVGHTRYPQQRTRSHTHQDHKSAVGPQCFQIIEFIRAPITDIPTGEPKGNQVRQPTANHEHASASTPAALTRFDDSEQTQVRANGSE